LILLQKHITMHGPMNGKFTAYFVFPPPGNSNTQTQHSLLFQATVDWPHSLNTLLWRTWTMIQTTTDPHCVTAHIIWTSQVKSITKLLPS